MPAEAALNYIRYLTQAIGPRNTMTEGEYCAAAYVQQVMCSLGLRDVRIEPFTAHNPTTVQRLRRGLSSAQSLIAD